MTFKLTVMEICINDFMCIFEEADTFTVRSVYFGLSKVDDLLILEKFRSVESRFSSQNKRRTVLDNKQFLQFQLNISKLSSNKSSLIVKIIKIKLCFLQHFFFTIFINLQLTAHSTDQNIESFIHLLNRLEFTSFYLLQ